MTNNLSILKRCDDVYEDRIQSILLSRICSLLCSLLHYDFRLRNNNFLIKFCILMKDENDAF